MSLDALRTIPAFFVQPARVLRNFSLTNLRADFLAGVTVAIILLPQAIAYALIGELPPAAGLFSAIVGAIVAALWGSSHHLQTGPTNALSLLVLSALLPIAVPNSPQFLAAAGLMAVMVGVFQVLMGVARMGILVNFVSDAVIVGFTAGAGILIGVGQLRHLFGLEATGRGLVATLQGIAVNLPETHLPTLLLGVSAIVVILLLRRLAPKLPSTLISLIVTTAAVYFLGLHRAGVSVIGELPTRLPPLADLPLFNLDLIAQLSTGALAAAAIGLIQTVAIARSLATQTGQRLDSNQEFVGQGLANIACGFFSGYTSAGSFGRSAVNLEAGARSPLAALFSGVLVAVAMLTLAPFAAFLPRAALAGVLLLVAYGLVDRKEMARIWRGARGDAVIMWVTLVGTLFLPIEFAVLAGILMSLGYYILRTSSPQVHAVVPDEKFGHLMERPDRSQCPQLGILDIHGDLYFGAVNHIENKIHEHVSRNPSQRFLLLRMHGVNHCDFSGIRMLENLVSSYRGRNGDVYMTRVRSTVLRLMQDTHFDELLGADHFLHKDEAIEYLFHHVLDSAICIYESDVRVFAECQNLPRPDYPVEISLTPSPLALEETPEVTPAQLWEELRGGTPPRVIDVREPREFQRGHVPQAQLIPLPSLLTSDAPFPPDGRTVLVCRSGRRSLRAAHKLRMDGYQNLAVLQGGLLAWRAENYLEAIEQR